MALVSSIDVVTKVAHLLRAVAATEPVGGRTSALAREAGLTRTTAHRLLCLLRDQGLVERPEDGVSWVLGPELYLLGSAAARRYDVSLLAQPFVRRLATATAESAFFSVARGEETVCLVREEGSFPLRSHVLYEGIRFPLGVASAGIAILAFLPQREVDSYLDRVDLASSYGPAHERSALEERLNRAREQGYAVNPGLIVEGSWGMAAAVFDEDGRPIGALSLTGVEHRFAEDRRPALGTTLMHAAHRLSTALAEPAAG